MRNRLKTYSFWVSLSGALVVLIQAVGRAVGFIANADIINNIIMSIAGILVVFGIVSTPSEEELNNSRSENETDKKEDNDQDDTEDDKSKK